MDKRTLAWFLVLAMLGPLALAATATSQAGGNALYETTDGTGDVEFQTQGQGADAPAAATQSTDLVAFRILDENAETMMLEIQVADMRGPDSNTDSYYDPTVYIRFRVEGSPAYYHLFAMGITAGPYSGLTGDDAPWPVNAILCINNNENQPIPAYYFDVYANCYYQNVPAITFPADDVVQILVPKLALLGVGGEGDARPGGIPKTIDAGERLVDWRVQSQKRAESLGFGFFISGTATAAYRDQMPDEGVAEPYTLKAPAANAKVSLRAQGAAGGAFTGAEGGFSWDDIYPVSYVSIAPGQTAVVPIDVYNGADAKRLVNLTARFPGDGAGRFDVRLAPVMEVPSGEVRKVNLLLNVTRPLAHRETVDLEVRGTSLGQAGEVGSALIRLIGNEPPSPEANVLSFHAIQDYGDDPRIGPSPLCLFGCSWRFATWMNTMADDPLDEVGNEGYRSTYFATLINAFFGYNIIFTANFGLDAPLAKDLHYDPGVPVQATLAFSAGTDIDATVRLYLSGTIIHDDCPADERCAEQVYLGEAAQDLTIGTDPSAAQLSFVVPPDLGVLASAGGYLSAEVVVESDDPRAMLQGSAEGLDLLFYPSQSTLTLPIVPDPDPDPAGDLFVGLSVAGENEEFVNPGKTRAFHVLAVNEGVEDAAIRIDASPDADGWTARVEPGAQYRLGPGQSVNVTILVSAPAGAKEGDAAVVEVAAHDRSGEGSSLPVTLKAIATTGLDIDDEGGPVEADEDTKARLDVGEGGESPGLGVAALAGVFASAVLALRRRR